MEYRGSDFDPEEFKKKGGKVISYKCFKTVYISDVIFKCIKILEKKVTDEQDSALLQRFLTHTFYRVDDLLGLQRICSMYQVYNDKIRNIFTDDLKQLLEYRRRGLAYTMDWLELDNVVVVKLYMPMRSKKVKDNDELIAIGRQYGTDVFWGTVKL